MKMTFHKLAHAFPKLTGKSKFIIGLLIAGVTGGASLIKSSQLRAVMSEARAFATAINGFYNQFNYLPGDYGTAIGGSSYGDSDGTIEYYNGTVIVLWLLL